MNRIDQLSRFQLSAVVAVCLGIAGLSPAFAGSTVKWEGSPAPITGASTSKKNLATAILAVNELLPGAQLWQMAAGSFITFSGELESCKTEIPETGWTYFFWSSKTRTNAEVMICGNEVQVRALGGGSNERALVGESDFIDTDAVGKLLKKESGRNKCQFSPKTWSGRLRLAGPGILTWVTRLACNDMAELVVSIDARTGKVLDRHIEEETP